MCGIIGSVGAQNIDVKTMKSLLNILKHRGPDDEGLLVGKNFILGMRRLAIVNLNSGSQPVSAESNKVHLVFNGEIYNYKQLQNKYLENECKIENASEAKILLSLYVKYGINFIKMIKGMFAIAIFDENMNKLFIIRDRVGKKPLYYANDRNKTLFFASEAKALYPILKKKTFRKETVMDVMTFGYIPPPSTAFEEIKILEPGHYITFDGKELRNINYWKPNYLIENDINYQDAKEITKKLLIESVNKRLITERPVGAFLSGGVDSSLVTAIMSKTVSKQIETFSIGFSEKKYDESFYSFQISKLLGTRHNNKIILPDPNKIEKIYSDYLDQPFADSSIIPSFELAEFAKEKVVVALGGDGGDEVFGGYRRYSIIPKLVMISKLSSQVPFVIALLNKFSKNTNFTTQRILRVLESNANLANAYLSIMSLMKLKYSHKLLNDHNLDSSINKFLNDFELYESRDDLTGMMKSDFSYYLPGDLLIKADISSMSNGLELRSPLLDTDLIDWVNRLPSRFKLNRNKSKIMLKDIASEYLGKNHFNRRKMGFAIPRADWMRNELWDLTNDYLTDSTAKSRGWFNHVEIKSILDLHKSGKDMDSVLWPALTLEIWARNWLDPK